MAMKTFSHRASRIRKWATKQVPARDREVRTMIPATRCDLDMLKGTNKGFDLFEFLEMHKCLRHGGH
jgi:hypothetical protein